MWRTWMWTQLQDKAESRDDSAEFINLLLPHRMIWNTLKNTHKTTKQQQ